jgi:hypothetical protein
MLEISMQIRLENNTGIRKGRFVKYEFGTDLFGQIYLDKIKGRERGKLVDRWVLNDFGSLFRVLDLEIYKREVENYENTLTTRPAFR